MSLWPEYKSGYDPRLPEEKAADSDASSVGKPDILPPLTEDEKMVAALAYPFWFVVSPMVFFLDKKKEPFVHFHAFQALIFSALSAVGLLVSFFVMALLFRLISLRFFVANVAVGGILFFVLFSAYLILVMADVLLILYCAYRTFQGETFAIPFITPFVRRKISL